MAIDAATLGWDHLATTCKIWLMTKTLITGANKGLGYQTARRLLAEGHEVWVAARDPRRGAEAAHRLGARFVQLDVTDDDSVTAAAEVAAKGGGVDVLINDAGISDRTPVIETAASSVARVFDTNVLGPVRVLQAFTRLLDVSSCPVVVNVSSGVGSLAYAGDPRGSLCRAQPAGLPRLKGCSQHAHHPVGQGPPPLAGELRRPRLHGHRLQPEPGYSDGRGGNRRHRRTGDRRASSPDGCFSDRNGTVPLVTSGPAPTTDVPAGHDDVCEPNHCL